MTTVLLCLLACVSLAVADYNCVCNYNVEEVVHTAPIDTAATAGYMYEFDCKENIPVASLTTAWLAVAFEHQLGYLQANSAIQIQKCQGNPPAEDRVTTTSSASTTIAVTTTTSTTTTTPKPTTTSTTTTSTTPTPKTTTLKPTTATTKATTATAKPTTTTAKPTTTTTTPKPTTTTSTTTSITTSTTTTTTTPKPTTTTPIPTTTTPKPTTTTQKPTTTTPIPTTTTPMPITTTSKPTTSTQIPTTTNKPTTTHIPKTTHRPATFAHTTRQPTTHAPTTSIWSSPCDPLYHHYATKIIGTLTSNGHYCYEIVSNTTTWSDAEAKCQTKGGHLAHIASLQDQNFIYHFLINHFKHRVWIGLHDRLTEGHFQWTSGHAVSYKHWSPARNSLHHGRKDCVELDPTDHGYWKDLSCALTHFNRPGYICQYGGSDAVPTSTHAHTTHAPAVYTTAVNHNRLDGNTAMCSSRNLQHSQRYGTVMAQYSSNCYELIPNKKVSWNQAEAICKSNGGHLISITSAPLQTFIQSFMQRHLPDHAVWIGLNDLMWEGQFEWSSGSRLSYTHFIQGHTGNFMNRYMENCCVLVPYKGGKWDDIPCDSQDGFVDTFVDGGETHPPLCQYPIVTASLIG